MLFWEWVYIRIIYLYFDDEWLGIKERLLKFEVEWKCIVELYFEDSEVKVFYVLLMIVMLNKGDLFFSK